MQKGKSVIIIGSGIGGIVAAGNLASKGYKVTIFEKNDFPGGRCGRYIKDDHRFDVGATFLMMPGVYKEAFESVGKDMAQELKLNRIDPIYRIKFPGEKEILFSSDLPAMQSQFEKLEAGSYGRFLKLLNEGFNIYEKSMRLIDRNYFKFFDLSLIKYPFLLFKYKAFHNHHRYISRFFKSEELRALFTFQNLYLGQNPYSASGMYTFLPFMELSDGVYFPEGGMHEVAESLLSAAREHGVKVVLNSPVARIEVDNKLAKGVTLEDGTFHPADIIVSNADLPYVYTNLLPRNRKAKRLNNLKYSCSALVFHWGMDKVYPQLKQHNVFVSSKHKESCKVIFKENSFAEQPSIYVHSPVRSDRTAAPANQDSITAIVHTGNIEETDDHNWDEIKETARKAILLRLEEEGLSDFEKHIKFELCFTPAMWKSEFNLTRGGTFGSLAHNLMQMGFLRPDNHHKTYRNLYFVGGSTQPGSGMPLSLLSAKLVTERIERRD
ncbi:MAG: phytoene desaturase family protein [Bacteroidota bacterium]|nr:phytoene desaturase family protein [Bacteroidota bacterium]